MMDRRSFIGGSGALVLSTPSLAQPSGSGVLRFVPESNLVVFDPVASTAGSTLTHGYYVYDTLYGVSIESNRRWRRVTPFRPTV